MSGINKFNKSEHFVNEFIKKIYELDKLNNTLEEKINLIDILVNNLIDFCIKKKIFYFIENKITYTNISTNFKSYLALFLKNLIDPSNNIINDYIMTNYESDLDSKSNSNVNNISDINSLILKNYKKIGESSKKNVSFGDELQITNYDEICNDNNFEYNDFSKLNNLCDKSDKSAKFVNLKNKYDDSKYLSLYIKILINQNKYLVEFIDKLNQMCKILSDPDIEYNKYCPFDML